MHKIAGCLIDLNKQSENVLQELTIEFTDAIEPRIFLNKPWYLLAQ